MTACCKIKQNNELCLSFLIPLHGLKKKVEVSDISFYPY